MSGFEIAGIVLGGFPILIEAAQPLSRYFQGAERWWHFKRDFITLISTIEDESIAYSQNLELLLTPVDIDPEVKASLQEDSGSRLWYDPEIQAKLRGRIKIQYMSWFLRQLIEMRETLSEILGMLPIKKNGEVDFPRTTTVDYELLRLKQSFSTRRQHLLDKIVRINESLYKFLAKDSHINAEAARSSEVAPSDAPAFGPNHKSFIYINKKISPIHSSLLKRFLSSVETFSEMDTRYMLIPEKQPHLSGSTVFGN
ncbi:hypothetical protein CEP51_006180 [Fusarium floridanum]|uniref:Uncharacterized protein n=1 Tax=Fusarium floridanum TaxID=1325733 RepID=A0A428RUF1_9HYPO|nr:hypothetical protein CEP51_006180 [Fusarium floridanum]